MWNERSSSGYKSEGGPEGNPSTSDSNFEVISTQDGGPHDDFIIKIRVKKPSNVSYNTLNVTLEFGNSDDNTEGTASKSSTAIALDEPTPSTSRSTGSGNFSFQDTPTGSSALSFQNPAPSTSKTTGSGGGDPFWENASIITRLTDRRKRFSVRSRPGNDFNNLFQGLEKYLPQHIQEHMSSIKNEDPLGLGLTNPFASKPISTSKSNKLSTIKLTEEEEARLNKIFGPSKASEDFFKSLDKMKREQSQSASQGLYGKNANQSIKYIKPGKRALPAYHVTSVPRAKGIETHEESIQSNLRSPKVPTVKKDEKLFMKNRLVKSDIEKLLYFKAPDFAEKSRELPKILERLAARQEELEKRNCLRRRLLLDTNINIPPNKNILDS